MAVADADDDANSNVIGIVFRRSSPTTTTTIIIISLGSKSPAGDAVGPLTLRSVNDAPICLVRRWKSVGCFDFGLGLDGFGFMVML